jgi:hypothetical protein
MHLQLVRLTYKYCTSNKLLQFLILVILLIPDYLALKSKKL